MNDYALKQDSQWRDLGSIIKKFSPLIFFAALLPVLITAVTNPRPLTLFSKAEKMPELRLWFEPASVTVKPNRPFSLQLVAEFSDDVKIIPSLTINLEGSQGLRIDNPIISYTKSFQGRTLVGTINVVAVEPGTFTLGIPDKNVQVPFGEPLAIVTTPATINVRD